MKKLTVYGLPITPAARLEELAGASFCVSFATCQDRPTMIDRAIELVGDDQILMIDNGAFSHWRSTGETFSDELVEAYELWALEILDRCPNAVAVVPDVIQGSLEANEELRVTSLLPFDRSMPVWHLDEPISKLLHLCADYNWIAFGSTVDKPGSPAWHARIVEAFAAIDAWELESDGAYIRPRIHMMRAQAFAHLYPFDSSDSTNVAQNCSRQARLGETIKEFAARIDGRIQATAGPEAEHQTKRPIILEEDISMAHYDDLNDHPFAMFAAGESYVSPAEKNWLAWVAKVEKLLGHSLDGDQAEDGYSLDVAYDVFAAGATPVEYAKEI